MISRLLKRRPRTVRFEQAVYGSFAFRDAGYSVLARSPGCLDAWIGDLRAACQKLGERPAGVREAAGLLALRLPCGIWTVIGMSPQGCDDRGRPGALAFHALFLSPREARRVGHDPFRLAHALRGTWSADDTALPAGVATIEEIPPPDADDPRIPAIATAISARRRVLMEAEGPIDPLARGVWSRLTPRVRARASLATWTFGNDLRFDLAAVPRLAGITLDPSYIDPAALLVEPAAPEPSKTEAEPQPPPEAPPPRPRARLGVREALAALLMVALSAAAVWYAIGRGDAGGTPAPAPGFVPDRAGRSLTKSRTPAKAAPAPPSWPGREAHPPEPGDDDPGELRRVREVLVDLADRRGLQAPAEDTETASVSSDLPERMARLSEGLRYRGRWLTPSEVSELAASSHRDAPLAREWDAMVRRIGGPDRPLPPDFQSGPLRWQLAVLAWSLGATVPSGTPRRSIAEAMQAIAEDITVPFPLRSTALTDRHPALADYLDYLNRLPRR